MSSLVMSAPSTEPQTATAQPLRVMIAGGGTGGHLFPGIALAERVVAAGGEVCFVGTDRGIEARVLPEQGWPFERIEVGVGVSEVAALEGVGDPFEHGGRGCGPNRAGGGERVGGKASIRVEPLSRRESVGGGGRTLAGALHAERVE